MASCGNWNKKYFVFNHPGVKNHQPKPDQLKKFGGSKELFE
jgi:hypothetical protein